MVAYSFKVQFEEPIATFAKRQTVRGWRKRHARVGETMQLYCGMRTRHCRKILTPDPVCIDVQPISIEIDTRHPQVLVGIAINCRSLSDAEIEQFAVDDGFDGGLADGFARRRMGAFWAKEHAWGAFMGSLIRWDPQA